MSKLHTHSVKVTQCQEVDTTDGIVSPMFTDADLDFIGECLRIAQSGIHDAIRCGELVCPGSPSVRQCEQWLSQCVSLRERIEKR